MSSLFLSLEESVSFVFDVVLLSSPIRRSSSEFQIFVHSIFFKEAAQIILWISISKGRFARVQILGVHLWLANKNTRDCPRYQHDIKVHAINRRYICR